MKLLIVMYHYFREEVYPGGIYPVNQEKLAAQVDALSADYNFISQSDLLSWIRKGQAPEGNYCLLTFDDGLKEQMNAFRYLSSRGIPSIYYVSTSPLIDHKAQEVHKLHYIRTKLNDADLLGELKKTFDMSLLPSKEVLATQYAYDTEEAATLKYCINFLMNPEQKTAFTSSMFHSLVSDEAAFVKNWYMNENDLGELAANDALGAHGRNHLPLAGLNGEALQTEIDSIAWLENASGSKIHSFAYPYGGKTAVNDDQHLSFKNTRIEFALTTFTGVNTNEDLKSDNPFYLKRIDTNDAPAGKNWKSNTISSVY